MTKRKVMMSMLLIVALIFSTIRFESVAYASLNPLVVSKEASVSEVEAGKQFHYTISYNVNDLVTNYRGVTISDVLAEGIEFISITPSNDINDYSFDSETNTLLVSLSNLPDNYLSAGRTGFFQINVRIKEGRVIGGTVFTNKASIYADNVNPTDSEEVTVTVKDTKSYWTTSKEKISPLVAPVPGGKVKYSISLFDDRRIDQFGHISLDNAVIVDQLPTEAVYVSSTMNGSYNAELHQVIWEIPTLNVSETFRSEVVVRYPSESTTKGMTLINTVVTSGFDPWGNPVSIADSSAQVTFSDPIVPTVSDIGFSKSSAYTYRFHDQEQKYTISNIKNPGNVPLQAYTVIDDSLPESLDYTRIELPDYSFFSFFYKTSQGEWINYQVTEMDKSMGFIEVASLLQGDEYLKGFKFDFFNEEGFNEVDPGFDAGNIVVRATVRSNMASDENVMVEHGDVYTNTAMLSYVSDNNTVTATATAAFKINEPKPWLDIAKTHDNGRPYLPKDRVEFTLRVTNKNGATGELKSPKVYDVLPENFTYVEGSWQSSETEVGNFQVVTTSFGPNGNQTLLSWDSPALVVAIGSNYTISYTAVIDENTPATITNDREYYNDAYLTTQEHMVTGFWWKNVAYDWESKKGDIADSSLFYGSYSELDQDENTLEYLVSTRREIYINEYTSALVTKWCKGNLDDLYHKYPSVGKVTQGGAADYKLEIKNDGNVNIKSIKLLDILPHYGDSAVLSNQARNSQWAPSLAQMVTEGLITSGTSSFVLSVDYGLSYDKTYNNFSNDRENEEYWIDDFDSDFDITRVKALYFDITEINNGLGLAPGESIFISMALRAPVDTDVNIEAWNSVGVLITTMTNRGLNPTEPIKAGFKVNADPNLAIGNFVWFDANQNGLQDDGYDHEKAGINGVRLALYHESNGDYVKIDETISMDDVNGNPGYYRFPNLYAGNYYVEVIGLPSFYQLTIPNSGNDESDSDMDSVTMQSDIIALTQNDMSLDIGVINNNDVTMALDVSKEVISIEGEENETANVGDEIIYQIAVSNSGELPLTNISIQDTLDRQQSGFKWTSVGFSTSTMTNLAQALRIENFSDDRVKLSRLEGGETFYLRATYKVTASDADLTSLDNTVEVNTNETRHDNDSGEGVKASSSTELIHFVLEKKAIEDAVKIGDTIHYVLTLKSYSSIGVYDVYVKDTKIDFDSSSEYEILDQRVKVEQLQVGESITITGKRLATESSLSNSRVFKNTARVEHDDLRRNVKDTAKVGSYILVLDKSADKAVYTEGESIQFNIKVINDGSESLSNIVLDNDFLQSSKSSEAESLTDQLPSTTIDLLPVGSSATVILDYDLTNEHLSPNPEVETTKRITNSIIAKSDETEVWLQDSVSVDIESIALTKSISGSKTAFLVGETIPYIVDVVNNGSITLNNVTVIDELFNVNGGLDSKETILSVIPALRPGQKVTLSMNYVVTESDLELNASDNVLYNQASVVLEHSGKTIHSNKVAAYIYNLNVKKDARRQIEEKWLREGDKIDYTFTVSNTGSAPLTGVRLVDEKFQLPDDLSFIGDLAPNEVVTRSFTYTVLASDLPAPISNTVRVGSNEGAIASDTNNIGGAEVTFTKNVVYGHLSRQEIIDRYDEILVSNSIDVVSGSHVTYVFTVENIGETFLGDIRIIDETFGDTSAMMMYIHELSSASPSATAVNKVLAGYPMNDKLVFAMHKVITGDTINTARVIANPVDEFSNDLAELANEEEVAKATVNIVVPSILVEKVVYRGDSSTSPSAVDAIVVNDKERITFRFIVTNDGKIPLSNITFEDDQLVLQGYDLSDIVRVEGNDILMPGERAIYEITVMAYTEYTNSVTVSANPVLDDGSDITVFPSDYREKSTDTASVTIEDYAMEVTKTAKQLNVILGNTIDYTIVVSNRGDHPLENVRIVDLLLGIDEVVPMIDVRDKVVIEGVYRTHTGDLARGRVINTVEVFEDHLSSVTASATVIVNDLPITEFNAPFAETENDDEEEIIEIPDVEVPLVTSEEVIIPDEDIPKASIEELPQTSGMHSLYFYMSGLLFILFGGCIIFKEKS